mgnify:CR=1 FL=1
MVTAEFNHLFMDTIRSELVFIDLKLQDLPVTIDIDLLRIPCEIADIRFMSNPNREHRIERVHINPKGEYIPFSGERNIDEIVDAAKEGWGCKIKGIFYKHFLMNHFFLSYGNPMILSNVQALYPSMPTDLSHRVNSLYLGNTDSHAYLEKEYALGSFNAAKGTAINDTAREGNEFIRHTYWVKVAMN